MTMVHKPVHSDAKISKPWDGQILARKQNSRDKMIFSNSTDLGT